MKTFEEALLAELYEMITPSKVEMFEQLAPLKTNHVTVVLENIYQEHNASAVLRTCESFGIQSLHVIEKDWKYQVQRDIARGAGRWVDMYNYNDENPTVSCLKHLKSKGYRILATTPHEKDCTIDEVAIDAPVALVFGTEGDGISQDVMDLADEFVKIPMYGFTESFNISVSAAVSMYALRTRLEKSEIDWKLTPEELVNLKIRWCQRIIPHGDKVVPEVIKRLKNSLQNQD